MGKNYIIFCYYYCSAKVCTGVRTLEKIPSPGIRCIKFSKWECVCVCVCDTKQIDWTFINNNKKRSGLNAEDDPVVSIDSLNSGSGNCIEHTKLELALEQTLPFC